MSGSNKKKKEKTEIRWGRIAVAAALFISAVLLSAFLLSLLFPETEEQKDGAPEYAEKVLLTKNEYSRPGTPLKKVNDIVIHYVGNPGTSAKANRNYFENLRLSSENPDGVKASAHFIVGLTGETVQCIPLTEIAYANYPRNEDTVSIEVCHPDESGEFNEETYRAVVKLTADLLRKYGLTEENVIRHYDVSGKSCPKYYVEHEDAWLKLKEDVRQELNKGE